MDFKKTWTVGLIASIAIAAACSAAGGKAATGSGGNGTAAGGNPTGGGHGGSSSTLSGMGGSGGSIFGDGGPDDAAQDHQGPAQCDPSCQAAGGQCMGGTCMLSDNTGNIDPATQAKLRMGGSGDPGFKFVYPYDKTVFPRGLLPPTLQFNGNPADAIFVHASAPNLDYRGFYGASNPGALTFSPAIWKAISYAAGANAVKIDVTKLSGGQAAGPIEETWTMAQGSLRGTIYYETYGSQILGGAGSVGIMKIQPGATMPVPVKSGCGNVCHTASADGSTLVAATQLAFSSSSYDLRNNANTIMAANDYRFTYGGLYPDGSFVLSATSYRTWIGSQSHAYDTKSGAQLQAPGWDGVINNSGTPAFSPDGKKVAFQHLDQSPNSNVLAVMSFNKATMQFTQLVDLVTDPSNALGWPAFTPDTKWLVYHAGSNPQWETDNGATGDIFYADVNANFHGRLDALDGYSGPGGTTYLPANDPHLNFAPTVLPEAVGGYFWVVFTSHRSYGNTLPSMANSDQDGKLWVAAFDLSPTPGKDPSHPAFYLDGQEAQADNLRGFWVLDPCKMTGNDCTTGDECCTGFCRDYDGGFACVPPPGGCSHEFEKCAMASDCCDTGYDCINGHCAKPMPK